ncbi:hypothetical protein VTN77DRAFT_7111 [Rasamsonia byssochlamydoides]|uniref:uncharacterized protein n=1 Tax=Rasamsonia byssochlamydoides TaxID=89139 RepID=UPI003742A060
MASYIPYAIQILALANPHQRIQVPRGQTYQIAFASQIMLLQPDPCRCNRNHRLLKCLANGRSGVIIRYPDRDSHALYANLVSLFLVVSLEENKSTLNPQQRRTLSTRPHDCPRCVGAQSSQLSHWRLTSRGMSEFPGNLDLLYLQRADQSEEL